MKTTILMTLFISLSIIFAGFQNKTEFSDKSVRNTAILLSTDTDFPWILTAYADAVLSSQRLNELGKDITERLIIEFEPNENQITTTGFLKKEKIQYELTADDNFNCQQFRIMFDSIKTQLILSDETGDYVYKQLEDALDLVQPNGFPSINNNLFRKHVLSGNYQIIDNNEISSNQVHISRNTIKGIPEWEDKRLNIWFKVELLKENLFTFDKNRLNYQWSIHGDTLILKNVRREKATSEYHIGDIKYELLKSK